MTTPTQPRHPLALLADMRAEAEVLYLNSDPVMVALQSTFARLESALRAQAEAEAGLREALAWYADPASWERGLGREGPQDSPAMDDEGQRARAALAQAQAGAGSEGQGEGA